MKKLVYWSIFCIVFSQSTIPADIGYLARLKSQLHRELVEFNKCIYGDHCDPMRKGTYTAIGIIISLILATLAGRKVVSYFTDKPSIPEQPIQEPVEQPQPKKREFRLGEWSKEEEEDENGDGYESADEEFESEIEQVQVEEQKMVHSGQAQQEARLQKLVDQYTDLYFKQNNLLTQAMLEGRKTTMIAPLINPIQQRQKQAGNWYRKADQEKDLATKLQYLKNAINELRKH